MKKEARPRPPQWPEKPSLHTLFSLLVKHSLVSHKKRFPDLSQLFTLLRFVALFARLECTDAPR